MFFNQSDIREEFARHRNKKVEYRHGQTDLEHKTANEKAAIDLLEKEKSELVGQAVTYYMMLTVIFLLFFAIHAPSYGYLPAAAFCALILTPQLLKFHYRLRQFREAEKKCNEEQLKKVIYFSDAHSKTIFPKAKYPRVIQFFQNGNNAEKLLLDKLTSLKSIKQRSVEVSTPPDFLFKLSLVTKSYFLSGSQKVTASLSENEDHFWLLISSLPSQRRRTLEMGRNKINVLLFHDLIMHALQEIHHQTGHPLSETISIDLDKVSSFSPEHLPIPIDKVA